MLAAMLSACGQGAPATDGAASATSAASASEAPPASGAADAGEPSSEPSSGAPGATQPEGGGAAGIATTASIDGKYDPPITVSTVRFITDQMQSNGVDRKPDVMEDNLWYRDYRDILGINVSNAWEVPESQYRDKLNTQIAANDLPDFFLCYEPSQLKQVVEYGMAADMTDIFEEHAAPFTREMMEVDNKVGVSQATFGGRLMALPQVNGNRDSANLWWVRKDWMDNLGIAEPTTMEEFIEMCRRFAADDPDGNGAADTVGMGVTKELFGGTGYILPFAEGYGAYLGNYDWVDAGGGQLGYGSVQPAARDALEALAGMYRDGILDSEFIVKDNSKISEEIIAGRIGVVGGQHWQAFWPLPDVRANEPEAEWIALPILPGGSNSAPKTMLQGSAGRAFVVNANCASPEAVVKLYNYYYLKDCALSPEWEEQYHGQIDVDPNWPVDQYFAWSAVSSFYPMQNMFIHIGVEKFLNGGDDSDMGVFWVSDNVKRIKDYLDNGNEGEYATSIWSGPGDYSGEGRAHYYENNGMFLQNAYIGAPTDSAVQYQVTLDDLRLTTFTQIIMGEKPISEFDSFVQQWRTLGGDSITSEVNEAAK
ncbi:MAG: extracellular solute-binding protein [Clostridiales bacterium]|nr:extracellular solute-binding protein [Clostridiales bacterium]